MKPLVYLASQSPRRKEILQEMKIAFRVVSSSYEEKPKKTAPAKLVLEHAVGKAKSAEVCAEQGFVIGSDTIVYCRRRILGKPKSMKQAYQMLEFISGRAHCVYTGVAVRDLATGKVRKAFDKTKVYIKKLSREEMTAFFKKAKPLDKAGAYAIQVKPSIVHKIEGSYSNVVGLPKELLRRLLSEFARRRAN